MFYLKSGFLELKKMSDESYKIEGHQRGIAGGPITGAVAYWLVKTLCYGTIAAGATTAVVATGGAAGAITGGLVATATLGASAGATVAGGVIAGAGLATGSVAAAAGSVAGVVAAIETASTVAFIAGTACVFLP